MSENVKKELIKVLNEIHLDDREAIIISNEAYREYTNLYVRNIYNFTLDDIEGNTAIILSEVMGYVNN